MSNLTYCECPNYEGQNSWHIDILQYILYHTHLLKQNGSDKLLRLTLVKALNQATQKLLLFSFFLTDDKVGGVMCSCQRSISKTHRRSFL